MAALAGDVEERRAVGVEFLAEGDGADRLLADQLLELHVALAQRQRAQVAAVKKEKVEGIEHDFGSGLAIETGLKRCEARPAVIVEHDSLAIDDGLLKASGQSG